MNFDQILVFQKQILGQWGNSICWALDYIEELLIFLSITEYHDDIREHLYFLGDVCKSI